MNRDEADIAECVEDFRVRRGRGESIDPERYRERLSTSFDEFVELITTDSMFDEALQVPSEFTLPKPFGRYTLIRELGRGSVGVVYEALDEQSSERRAVKVLRSAFSSDPATRRRFLREAQACAQVVHGNIVGIHDAGEAERRPYYAMDLIRGAPLSELIRRGDVPEPRMLCQRLAGVASALQALHSNGVVHRDVKPSNILMGHDGNMVLADFGLVRLDTASTLTRTGSTLGTPLYMSPEQMMGDSDVDGRADVYGLGATLYEALTGEPPFTADEYHQLVPKILGERPRAPDAVSSGVPGGCARIALQCLEKQPADRYPSAAALADDLRAFAEGRPVVGGPLGRARRGWRWILRHPVPSAVGVMLLAALLGFWIHEPPPEPAWLNVSLEPWLAEIHLNEGPPLDPPLERLQLDAGHYVMRCSAEDFNDKVIEFDARAGGEYNFNVSLSLPFPISPEKLAEISKRLDRRTAPSDED